jgi:hypothetical protein
MATSDEKHDHWTTRLPTEVSDAVDDYRRERGLSKSRALEELVRDGLNEPNPWRQWACDLKQLADHLVAAGPVIVALLAMTLGRLWPAVAVALTAWATAAVNYLLAEYLRERY